MLYFLCVVTTIAVDIGHHSEPTLVSTPLRMNGKWLGNNFLLGSGSLTNHGQLAQDFFPNHLLPIHKQVVSI
jgi:hypothetical protein